MTEKKTKIGNNSAKQDQAVQKTFDYIKEINVETPVENLYKKMIKSAGVPADLLNQKEKEQSHNLQLHSYDSIKDAIVKAGQSLTWEKDREFIKSMESASRFPTAGDVTKLIQMGKKDEVIRELIVSMNATPTMSMIKGVKDFISRNGRLLYQDYSVETPASVVTEKQPDKQMEQMVNELKTINGVKGAQLMFDNYPESMTVIVKLNMGMFTEEESNASMIKIETILEKHRPDDLQELEVLYHNRVVY